MGIEENTTIGLQNVAVMDTPEGESPAHWRGPLFVIGMWRSGTSLLYALLNKHPQIALLYEGDLHMLKPLFWMPAVGKWKLRRWEFWNQGLERHNLDVNDFSGADLRTIAGEAYRQYAHNEGALIGGEKSPNYFDGITRLAHDFPDARFIVIWRGPAAICSSVIRAANQVHSWFDRRGMWLRVLLGMEAMRTECNRLVQRGTPIHELSYESLVQDPVETMKGICQFLEIPFVAEMASLEGADRSAIYEGGPHERVKSQRIISSSQQPDVLPEKLKKKISRYLGFWQETYGESWPQIPHPQTGDKSKLGLVERISDQVLYRCLRLLDAGIILAYCLAPIRLLTWFRSFKYKREEARAKNQQAQASS
jgi:Sulfotransferase family